MSIDVHELRQMLQQQLKLMDALTARLSEAPAAATVSTAPNPESSLATVSEFLFDPAANVTFDSWYTRYEDLFNIDLASQDDGWKVRQLLRKLGPAEYRRYANFILPKLPRDVSFKDTVSTLKRIFGECTSIFNSRYQCLQLTKKDTDDFITYAGIVNQECARFQLGSLTEDQFKCLIFICGLRSPKDADIRTRLLTKVQQDPNLTLQQVAEECQNLLNLKHDSAMIQNRSPSPTTIHAVSTNRSQSSLRVDKSNRHTQRKSPPSPCRHCGAWHFHRDCHFKNHRCQKCKEIGHKDGFCQPQSPTSQISKPKRRYRRPTNRPHTRKSLSLHANFQVNAVGLRQFVNLSINGHPARLQLDTASDITIISSRLWRSLGSPAVRPSTRKAISACGGSVRLTGQLHCSVSFRGTTIDATCYVSNVGLNLLGLDWLQQLGLLDLPISAMCNQVCSTSPSKALSDQIVQRFPDVFQDGLGRCTCTQVSLKLLPDSQPVFRPKRPVPYAALPLVDQELRRLENLGILVPVNYSKWAAPIVVVKKSNGSLRICADFSTGLNAALEPNCYPLPVPEDIFTILNGGTCFAKLDLAEAYFQIEVAPDSRELLTINTHRGLFQYTRLPFGVKTAPALFQQVMDAMISGLAGTAAYLDDIIIMGRSRQELQERIATVLQRMQDYGFRLRADKCQFFLPSIKYLGFIFDAQGRRPDPESVRAIQRMPPPKDVPTLRSFLGLISYYSNFLPALHDVRAPLNRLLQKDSPWCWSPDCETSFARLKTMLCSDLLLTHFDPHLPIVVAADASNYGVGAVISHTFPDGSEKAICHASRTLTPAEKNYSQIEKEALALVFAVKKFHKFLYGRHFTLLSDHKPLLSIFGSKKGIPVFSASRLQRWATILLGYDFEVQYRRTTDFGQADALSRLIGNQSPQEEDTVIATVSVEDEVRHQLDVAIRGIPVTATDVRRATERDPTLKEVIKFIQTSWPSTAPTGDMKHFFHRRESLSVVNACLMTGDRVVIPSSLRPAVLRQFHSGHPGMARMKALARGYVYWPGMDADIESVVKSCSSCQQAAKSPPKQDPVPWPTPKGPWSRLHVDFAGPIDGVTYLVLVDAHSKWPEVVALPSATSSATITCLRHIFSQHGLPEVIVSDNGTQFTSAQFAEFCARANIQHIRSPPYHPQSNGQVERFVDTFKRALLKSRGEGTSDETIQAFLLAYRSTPNPALDGQTPAEVLMGRKLRTIHHALLPISEPAIRETRVTDHAFQVGRPVYARDYRQRHGRWAEGIISAHRGKVMFDVNVNGETWVRHRNQIRPRLECSTLESNYPQLPLDILLDTFDIPSSRPLPEEVQPTMDASLLPCRWSDRIRRPTQRIQLDPRTKRYR